MRAQSGSFLARAGPGLGMHSAEPSTSMKGAHVIVSRARWKSAAVLWAYQLWRCQMLPVRVVRPGRCCRACRFGGLRAPGSFGCLCRHHHGGGGAIGDRAAQAPRGVKTVGILPQGVPVPALPWTKWSDVGPLLVGTVGIILVSLTDTIATATSFASRRGDEVDPDQEMVGIGTSNIAAGFFQGFAVSVSACRAAVVDQSGARTQLTGLVGAAWVARPATMRPRTALCRPMKGCRLYEHRP